jgi:hypothetical protein
MSCETCVHRDKHVNEKPCRVCIRYVDRELTYTKYDSGFGAASSLKCSNCGGALVVHEYEQTIYVIDSQGKLQQKGRVGETKTVVRCTSCSTDLSNKFSVDWKELRLERRRE